MIGAYFFLPTCDILCITIFVVLNVFIRYVKVRTNKVPVVQHEDEDKGQEVYEKPNKKITDV